MSFSKEKIVALREKFPDESLQTKQGSRDKKTGQYKILVGYKPQYIIERLNDVLGHEEWDFEVITSEIKDGWGVVLGRLSVYEFITYQDEESTLRERRLVCKKEQFGTATLNAETGAGDCLKGAATNSLEKCSSLLDIGHLAYKGKEKVHKDNGEEVRGTEGTEEVKETAPSISSKKSQLSAICAEKGIKKVAFNSMIKNVLKEDKKHTDLTSEDLDKLIEHVKSNGAPF